MTDTESGPTFNVEIGPCPCECACPNLVDDGALCVGCRHGFHIEDDAA